MNRNHVILGIVVVTMIAGMATSAYAYQAFYQDQSQEVPVEKYICTVDLEGSDIFVKEVRIQDGVLQFDIGEGESRHWTDSASIRFKDDHNEGTVQLHFISDSLDGTTIMLYKEDTVKVCDSYLVYKFRAYPIYDGKVTIEGNEYTGITGYTAKIGTEICDVVHQTSAVSDSTAYEVTDGHALVNGYDCQVGTDDYITIPSQLIGSAVFGSDGCIIKGIGPLSDGETISFRARTDTDTSCSLNLTITAYSAGDLL